MCWLNVVSTMHYSINISLRLLAATIGAYILSILFSLALVPLLVLSLNSQLSDAVYAATMWSYVAFFLVFIAAFSVATVKRLYFILLSLSGTLYGIFSLANPFISSVGN